MEPITVFVALSAAVSSVQTVLVHFIKVCIVNGRVKDEEKRKATISLISLALGMILGILINIIGGFGLPLLTALAIGGGMSYTTSNLTDRTIKVIKEGK